ncbi:uncharacterized protein VP01_1380g9 [Puccinia sorghi]|uniref:No apical meristem-associated C-terminal domain-containing protein n=1 Tax=Puccinia sorghi TaxID=27349 RepID=A0A0L6VLE6_9BASI|nr:uncharacterized protein VP01_1380g9 [Puccinia sorghi]
MMRRIFTAKIFKKYKKTIDIERKKEGKDAFLVLNSRIDNVNSDYGVSESQDIEVKKVQSRIESWNLMCTNKAEIATTLLWRLLLRIKRLVLCASPLIFWCWNYQFKQLKVRGAKHSQSPLVLVSNNKIFSKIQEEKALDQMKELKLNKQISNHLRAQFQIEMRLSSPDAIFVEVLNSRLTCGHRMKNTHPDNSHRYIFFFVDTHTFPLSLHTSWHLLIQCWRLCKSRCFILPYVHPTMAISTMTLPFLKNKKQRQQRSSTKKKGIKSLPTRYRTALENWWTIYNTSGANQDDMVSSNFNIILIFLIDCRGKGIPHLATKWTKQLNDASGKGRIKPTSATQANASNIKTSSNPPISSGMVESDPIDALVQPKGQKKQNLLEYIADKLIMSNNLSGMDDETREYFKTKNQKAIQRLKIEN